ncbi:MAG: UDP-N-acetylmuramoyl-tripeptide--D-alanyl-D-alanine ligase [Acidobacteria bacterium]|nr:UDP-N-acetylmuramoyl-tripeptide--D-alanyl-D-alanine ligase [Acidobacteriota bacterium]MBS1866889.1 UDP-N-acetylmuramoyl-tripeptide--D-alanyl-D-alanine ligase [Acidobacteriota bacterium]
MRWTIAQVAGALGTRPGAGLDPMARVAGVSIDSRSIRTGELFVAIHGPRHDGHTFVADVLAAGALAAVVAQDRLASYPEAVRGRCIAVADTFVALKQLAREVRQAWGGKIAGVTGSVGKTTTKEILAALLSTRLRVLKSEGNFNNEYGLSLTLFKLEESHQAAVLEMGMSRRGELSRLAEIARPDVGVVTRVSPAHLEFFSSVDEIALAKRELIEGLNGRESTAVLNADDPRVAGFGSYAPGRVLTYGIEQPAFFSAQAIEDRGALGSAFDYVSPEGRVRLELSLPGRHVIANALASLAAASVWGIGVAEAQTALRTMRAPSMRGELLRFSNGAALINDSYNSSPAALHAMTALLAATPGFQRRILAAGEMRELGASSGALHREAGALAAKSGKVDWIIGVAGDAAQIIEGAVAAGFNRTHTTFFASSEEAGEFVRQFFQPGDLLLVKGSRGVKMERIVDALISVHAATSVPREEVRH